MMTTMPRSWGEMAYFDSGNSGQPLLFLHGTGCDASDWRVVSERVPGEQRCIAPDFRGHGQSTVPTQAFSLTDLANDVSRLTDHLNLQELVIIGHSLGGMVAMEVARHSSSVAGLVLLEGWTSLSSAGSAFDPGRFYGSLSETAIAQIQQKAKKDSETVFNLKSGTISGNLSKISMRTPTLSTQRIPIYEVFGGMGRNDLTEKRLRIPPNLNIQWVWVPNAGHYLPHECPAEVAEVCIHCHAPNE